MKNFDAYLGATEKEINKALDTVIGMTIIKAKKHGAAFPEDCSERLFYNYSDNQHSSWTEGFWTGELWLAYEMTQSELLKNIALEQVQSFYDRIKNKIGVDHHDMGFLYSLSCIAAYQITGSEIAKKAAIMAADNLMERFHTKGQFFQAWGKKGTKDKYRLIIDCLMNVPLLFRISEITGDNKYCEAAKKHIKTSMKHLVRENNSTYHTYYFDNATGEPLYGQTAQGNRDDSAWARGQAWGVYGSALAYRYTGESKYLEIFRRVTEFFLNNLPNDLIPYWDFDFTDGSSEPRDSSAGAIVVCGLMEMADLLNNDEGEEYRNIARKLLYALIQKCAVSDISVSDGLLLHSTYCIGTDTNTVQDGGVDECCIWGDYFYMEALIRASSEQQLYW